MDKIELFSKLCRAAVDVASIHQQSAYVVEIEGINRVRLNGELPPIEDRKIKFVANYQGAL